MNEDWVPRTKLGRMVFAGDISTIEEAWATNLPIQEPEIVDKLLPDLEHKILEVNMTRRTTDSGRKNSFRVTVVVGNRDGIVGIGVGKSAEFRKAIEDGIKAAKLNLIKVRRGCGSWECGCGTPHSVPFRVEGKAGSVRVVLKPAPRGVGLVAADAIKPVLELAGIKDVWSKGFGHTKSTMNFALATFEALKMTRRTKLSEKDLLKVGAEI